MPESAVTRDGVPYRIRPIAPGDREHLARFVAALSPDTKYRRFLGPRDRLSETELTQLTEIDHHRSEAVVAVADDEALIGVARYVGIDSNMETAEAAVVVADEWQHRGVGTALLGRLISRAEEEGVRCFVATCLADNADMITLFRELGEAVQQVGAGGGVVELEISLPTHSRHLARPALRAAATTRATPGSPQTR